MTRPGICRAVIHREPKQKMKIQPNIRENASTKTQTRSSKEGFSLTEILICIVILGIISALALPSFISTTDTAEASATIGSMSNFAKTCGSNMIVNDPIPLSGMTDEIQISNSAICDGSTNTQISNTTPFNASNIGGLRCGGSPANGSTDQVCTLTINSRSGSVTGNWSP